MIKRLMNIKSIISYLFFLQTILNVVNISMGDIYRCKKETFLRNSTYYQNVVNALVFLPKDHKKTPNFTSETFGDKPNDKVNAIALCAGYSKPQDCESCISHTIEEVRKKCPNQKGATGWRANTCLVRYGPYVVNHYDPWFVDHDSPSNHEALFPDELDKDAIPDLVDMLLKKLNEGSRTTYVHGSLNYRYNDSTNRDPMFSTLYMVMQCTPNIKPDDCKKCLQLTPKEMHKCCKGYEAATIVTPNCFARYAHADFRNN